MKKILIIINLVILSFFVQAQVQKYNVDIIDFTADNKAISVDLLNDLKTEFQTQFQEKYPYFKFPPSKNKLTKLETEGYTDMKVVSGTDLAIIGKLKTDKDGLPEAIELDILVITDNYEVYSNPKTINQSSDKKEFLQLVKLDTKIIETAINVIFNDASFGRLIMRVHNDLVEKKKTKGKSMIEGSHEEKIKEILTNQEKEDIKNVRKLIDHVIDYEYKYNKEGIDTILSILTKDELLDFLYLEEKYLYFSNLRKTHRLSYDNNFKKYQNSTTKADSLLYLKKLIPDADNIIIYTENLMTITENLNNISFADDTYKGKNKDKKIKDEDTLKKFRGIIIGIKTRIKKLENE